MAEKEQKEQFEFDKKEVLEGGVRTGQAFDKNLTLIASGGLALSMTFVEKIGGADPSFILLLVFSWWFLGATLLFSLTSHLLITVAYGETYKMQTLTEKHLLSSSSLQNIENSSISRDAAYKKFKRLKRNSTFFAKAAQRTGYLAYLLLLIGIFLLISFASVNSLT